MHIRAETALDITAIETLTYCAFEGHPHHEAGAKPTEHLIINRLRDAGALALSLVAEDETGIIGHVAFSLVTIDGVDNWYGVAPVSVNPKRQGEGIGSQLIKMGLHTLKEQGALGCVVLGEPEYYSRFGFKAHPHLTLAGIPPEFFLIQALCPGNSIIPISEVTYHCAFNG